MSNGGKGSAPRPFSVSDKVFADNFDRIFGITKNEIQDNPSSERALDKTRVTPAETKTSEIGLAQKGNQN